MRFFFLTLEKVLRAGTPGSMQPHPPEDKVFDKVGSVTLQVHSTGKEKPSLPGDCVHCMLYTNIMVLKIIWCGKMFEFGSQLFLKMLKQVDTKRKERPDNF